MSRLSAALRTPASLLLLGFASLAVAGCSGNTVTDTDGDGSGDVQDCAPEDPAIYPGAADTPGDGVDQNCDGVDGTDADGDGFAGDAEPLDCDDSNRFASPAGIESCGNGADDDCDGLTDDADPDCAGDDDAGDDDAGDDDAGDDDVGDDDLGDDDAGDDDVGDDDAGDDDLGDDDAGDDDLGDDDAGDDDAGDDDVGDDDAGDDDTAPLPETACADGFDNDGDGATDCLDADCAAAFECTWPASWAHTATFSYDANFAARLGGYDDCTTEMTATLTMPVANPCAACDRSYGGATAYPATPAARSRARRRLRR
jgi:hypothetical protein